VDVTYPSIDSCFSVLEEHGVCQVAIWTTKDNPTPFYEPWIDGLNKLAERCPS
jgi:hypothetical protein